MNTQTATLGLSIALLLMGCDAGRPRVDTGTTPATVSGIVHAEGKPVTSGKIFFNPSNAERKAPTATASIGPDGSYSLETLIGGNEVRFEGPFLKKHPNVSLLRRFTDLNHGTNTIDFDLFGPGDTPRGVTPPRSGLASTH